jgi:hypothetical protein
LRLLLTSASAFLIVTATACPEDEPAVDEPSPESETEAPDETSAEPDLALPGHELAALEALGYVDHARADNPEERGVTADEIPDAEGLNLYGSRDRAQALLMNTEGEVVHRWESQRDESWMHVEPLGNGEVLAITRDLALAKYDWESEEVWRRRLPVHHDVAVDAEGRILALIRGRTTLSHEGEELPVLCDSIAILSPEGEVMERHSLLPLFRDVVEARRVLSIQRRISAGQSPDELLRPGGVADLLHTNSIAILRSEIDGVAPAGAILLSFRASSRLAILSADFDEVLWTWGRGELDGQHDATQLRNGNLMAFDNGLKRNAESRVIEIDPVAGEVVWAYDPPDLFTRLRGGAQQLSNGHVLITESDSGHALEVTREGEMVWEFWNPDVRGSRRATIYRLNRYPPALFPQLGS